MVRLELDCAPDISLPHTDVPSHATFATLIHRLDGILLVVSRKKQELFTVLCCQLLLVYIRLLL